MREIFEPFSGGGVTARKPRVWFINRYVWPDVSATSQLLSDLAIHLADSGYEVGVIASRGLYEAPSAALARFERHRGIAIHRVKRPRFRRGGLPGRAYDCVSMYARFALALALRARRGDVVIVKTDPPMLSCAIAPIARALGLRQINWLQDLYPEVALGLGLRGLKPLAPLLSKLRDWSLRGALNVAIGERMAGRLRARGVPASQVAVIGNWCDDEAIAPSPSAGRALRRAWGLEDKFVVGYSGNLGRAHECDTLLGAAERLRDRKDVAFLFVGGGQLEGRLRAGVHRRGLESAFHFHPYQSASALPDSLCVADVHWISLRPEMEGLVLPSKLYGVAAAGRPTIAVADPQGELADLVVRPGCGLAVTPGDPEALAEAILRLRDDTGFCAELGRNARAALDNRMTRARALARWATLIEREAEAEPRAKAALPHGAPALYP